MLVEFKPLGFFSWMYEMNVRTADLVQRAVVKRQRHATSPVPVRERSRASREPEGMGRLRSFGTLVMLSIGVLGGCAIGALQSSHGLFPDSDVTLVDSSIDLVPTAPQRDAWRGRATHPDLDETETVPSLAGSPPCCVSFNEFPLVDLIDRRTRHMRLDGRSPAFDFREGKSFFAAFRIDSGWPGARVTIEALVDGTALSSQPTVFAPRVLLLDERFAPSRVVGEDRAVARQSASGEPFWQLDLRLARNERYVVVYTDAAALGNTLRALRQPCSSDWRVFGLQFCPAGGPHGAIDVARAEAGSIRIELR